MLSTLDYHYTALWVHHHTGKAIMLQFSVHIECCSLIRCLTLLHFLLYVQMSPKTEGSFEIHIRDLCLGMGSILTTMIHVSEVHSIDVLFSKV